VPTAYRLDLWKTAWVVSEVDGTPLQGPTSIAFNEDEVENKATVRTPCGTTHIDWGLDTDGDEISLGDPTLIEQLDCAPEEMEADAAFYAALERVEAWTVQDDNHIQFSGTNDLSLVRQP
jgi:heat shock protein HslJ